MPSLLLSPGHQQTWSWIHRIICPRRSRGRFSTVCMYQHQFWKLIENAKIVLWFHNKLSFTRVNSSSWRDVYNKLGNHWFRWPIATHNMNQCCIINWAPLQHDDVIIWKHFRRYWPFVRGIHQWSVDSPHKAQWHGALMFSLICAWKSVRANDRDAIALMIMASL